MTDFDKATENLLHWTTRAEWEPRLMDVQADHLDPLVRISPDAGMEFLEGLGEAAGMLFAFMVEDFFTMRFGEYGESNVVDDYLERRGRRESTRGRNYLEAIRDSTPSLYEVVDIDRGRSLTVRDLLVPGEPVTVQENLGSQMAAPWDRLGARIVALDGERRFTGVLLHFREKASNDVLSAVDEMLNEEARKSRTKFRRAAGSSQRRHRTRAEASPMARGAIIRGLPCARILTHCWLNDALSQAQAPLPELRNTDDETLVLCEVRFPKIGDEAEIAAVLDGIKSFEREGDTDWSWTAPGSASYRLSRLKRGAAVADSETHDGLTALGSVQIEAAAVTLSVNSRERAERGQALLSARLGGLVGRALISSQDPYQAMEANREGTTPDDTESPSEEELRAIHAYLDDHYRRTLDEPLPMLGGRTLRQAAKSKRTRKEVIGWLKQLENAEYRRSNEMGQRAYDTRWIWEELGLGRPR